MPELRQNLITREWVIIATERAKRPNQFIKTKKVKKRLLQFQPDCPFCPGNESKTTQETFCIEDKGKWLVRSIQNKFPALSSDGKKIRKINGIYRSISGIGYHEIIIENQRHDLTTALLKENEIENIIKVYINRYKIIRKDHNIESIIIFKNHGLEAGTSIQHPHSQLVATPIVPSQVRDRLEEATRYFDDTGNCVFCNNLKEEIKAKERIISETDFFVAFTPYAALSPFHIWIFPKRHVSSFDDISDTELKDFAYILKIVLSKIYIGLKDPDYNYCIRSIPTDNHQTDYFHWYLSIIPRVSKSAGFELGSGMFINTVLPEESAKYLREIATDKI